jgi:hypothetical protein
MRLKVAPDGDSVWSLWAAGHKASLWPRTVPAHVAVDQPVARPVLAGIAETRPITMAASHLAAHLLLVRLLLEASVCVYSGAMEATAEGPN